MQWKYFFIIFLLSHSVFSYSQGKIAMIRPGEIWKDSRGNAVNAHGGAILYYQDVYYWFGEIKKGKTWRVPGITTWEDYRVNAGGISCYSSKDLLHWKYEGIALAPEIKDSTNDLHFTRVI